MNGIQSPDNGKLSRRDFLKLAAAGTGGLLGILTDLERRMGLVTGTLRLGGEQSKRFIGLTERLFVPPTDIETEGAFEYFNQTQFTLKDKHLAGDKITVAEFELQTPEGLRGKASGAVNRGRIKGEDFAWIIEGTPMPGLNAGVVEKEGEMKSAYGNIQASAIALGEPHDPGSPDFSHPLLRSMHGKELSAIGLWRLLKQGEIINDLIIKDHSLDLAGYSGGANAALVFACHFPESLKRLVTYFSTYDLFDSVFKERVLGLEEISLTNWGTREWLDSWMGKDIIASLVKAAKSGVDGEADIILPM